MDNINDRNNVNNIVNNNDDYRFNKCNINDSNDFYSNNSNNNSINKKSKYYFQRVKKREYNKKNNPFYNNNLKKYQLCNNYFSNNNPFFDYYDVYSHSNNNYYEQAQYNYDYNYNYYYYQIHPKDVLKENIEKKMVVLQTPSNLQDLIDIAKNNEICDDVEYNIDVLSLKNIYQELVELNEMIGADKIKQSLFEQLVYFMQNLHISDELKTNCLTTKNSGDYKHTVIHGPPGTGKTRIARIIGNMYSKIGILKNNSFKKVTRNDLIAGYLGQTAIKTKKLIEDNLGGVLFIDEAYSLSHENQDDMFSKECIDTLCEALSDYKDEIMIIIAGYEEELNNRFFKLNSGLESRFIWRFKMDVYNANELMKIFFHIVESNGWSIYDKDTIKERWFKDKKDNFKGLGRDMEALFTYTKIAHGLRIYGKDKELRKKISLEDMNKGYETFMLNNVKKDEIPSFMHSIYL